MIQAGQISETGILYSIRAWFINQTGRSCIGCLKSNDTLTIYLAEAIFFFQFILSTCLFSTMNQVVLCTYSEMHSHVHCIVTLWHWAKAECPFYSKPDVQESHHRKIRGQGSGCGHVTGWVNPSLGSEGHEDYFQSSERLVEEEFVSKIPCGWEEEWKAFHSEKSSKNCYF